MKTFFMRARVAAPALALAMAIPAVALAAPGFTDSRVALRAGPGGEYPRIMTLQRNTRVNIHGCIRRYDWCDVSMRGVRGWVPADELMLRHRGRPVRVMEYGPRIALPTLTFSFDTYWNDNYRRSEFYRDRDRYRTVWMRDQDRDGIPNRIDRDRDGDGVRNNRDRDRDGDGVRNDRDVRPNDPRVDRIDRDLDNDGIRNNRDRDRDGDGVRNDRDVRPNDPRVDRIDRDLDNDGIRNNRDRDRDGDGVRNRNDVAPNNPRRD
ncbi:MAG: SH3 domain-containing protein [Rhodospirillaceae bacterium]